MKGAVVVVVVAVVVSPPFHCPSRDNVTYLFVPGSTEFAYVPETTSLSLAYTLAISFSQSTPRVSSTPASRQGRH